MSKNTSRWFDWCINKITFPTRRTSYPTVSFRSLIGSPHLFNFPSKADYLNTDEFEICNSSSEQLVADPSPRFLTAPLSPFVSPSFLVGDCVPGGRAPASVDVVGKEESGLNLDYARNLEKHKRIVSDERVRSRTRGVLIFDEGGSLLAGVGLLGNCWDPGTRA